VSRVALLDINLLVALFDPDHIHHNIAHDWLADHRSGGWATCPVTENGLIRVLANPAYGSSIQRPEQLTIRLRTFCASGQHSFWPDAVSLTDERIFNTAFIRGHRQVTDVYLLGLALKMRGRLATFDRTIPLASVRGASRDTLHVVSAVAEP
jgi:toxin-antitoxin system PIN domain toxin